MRRVLPVLLLVAGCDAAAESPAWLVGEPRVLAISATPPAAFPNGSTRLAALVTDGVTPSVAVEGSWRACAPWSVIRDPDVDCGPDRSVPLPGDGSGGAVLSVPELADAFGVPVPELEPAQSACDVESPASISVVFEAQVDDRRLVAVKEVPIANAGGRNPELSTTIAGTALFEGFGLYEPGEPYRLETGVIHQSLDQYCDRDGDVQLERIRAYVYVTAGDLDDSRLDIEHDLSGNETAETAIWTAPGGGEVTMWLIATERGGRPGIGWETLTLAPR